MLNSIMGISLSALIIITILFATAVVIYFTLVVVIDITELIKEIKETKKWKKN